MDHKWEVFDRIGQIELRPCVPYIDAYVDTIRCSELVMKTTGFIARNPENPKDEWYLTAEYVAKNYKLACKAPKGTTWDQGADTSPKILHFTPTEKITRYATKSTLESLRGARADLIVADDIEPPPCGRHQHAEDMVAEDDKKTTVEILLNKRHAEHVLERYKELDRIEEIVGVQIGNKNVQNNSWPDDGQGMKQLIVPAKGWADDLDAFL